MNRQLKRANEKSDRRREREQERRKEQRRQSRVRVVKAEDSAPPEDKKDARPAPGMRYPWMAGAYLLLVIGVIAAQALVPQQTDPLSLVVHTLFYIILGYFLSLWFYRRRVAQALVLTIAGGMLLAFGVEGFKLVLPQGPSEAGSTEPNLLFTYLALPGLVLGAWLGRFIFRRSE